MRGAASVPSVTSNRRRPDRPSLRLTEFGRCAPVRRVALLVPGDPSDRPGQGAVVGGQEHHEGTFARSGIATGPAASSEGCCFSSITWSLPSHSRRLTGSALDIIGDLGMRLSLRLAFDATQPSPRD